MQKLFKVFFLSINPLDIIHIYYYFYYYFYLINSNKIDAFDFSAGF